MKLRQLQCVFAVVANEYSVTAAAKALFMSQPAVSKQIKLFEDSLGNQIFKRNNKSFIGLTPFGDELLPEIEKVLAGVESIRRLAGKSQEEYFSQLHIATTNTLARYALISVMPYMQKTYPQIPLDIIEGTNVQILDALNTQEADFGWFSAQDLSPYQNQMQSLISLPAMSWNLILLVPKDHKFAEKPPESLAEIGEYPLLTYITSHKGQSGLVQAMLDAGVAPKIAVTARSPDMIKSYVRSSMGVGAIADISYDEELDADLVALPLPWINSFHSYLIWHENKRLRAVHYDFIEQIVPGADKRAVQDYIRRVHLSKETEGWTI
ncbi:MAG: LysR family transcriptional regulator [Cardiobacteriaceae bacterium]|nr:LysR family transcriptional regulator [Cardiobacteriaceae bacterium]